MLSPVDYVVWFLGALLEASVVVCSLRSRSRKWYFSLTICMLGAFAIDVGRFVILQRSGFNSFDYKYFYFYSDAVSTILLYFVVMCFYQLVFQEMGVSRYIRWTSMLLLGATAGITYLTVRQQNTRLATRFVYELSQNLYFVGVVLTYLLWVALVKLRETRTQLVQFVLALGIYFSASAGAYALRNMYPTLAITKVVVQMAGGFLPAAWAYTFWKVPAEARLSPARMVTPRHR